MHQASKPYFERNESYVSIRIKIKMIGIWDSNGSAGSERLHFYFI